MGLLRNIIKSITKPIENRQKGRLGERLLIKSFNKWFSNEKDFRLINNLIIMDERGITHQIDHILIRHNGIFCIETKNIKGWLLGEENGEYWTQVLYTEKHNFLNPLKQNKSHIFHINRILSGKYRVENLIVMIKNNAGKINANNVVNYQDLLNYILHYKEAIFLNSDDVEFVYKTLTNSNANVTNKQHIKNVKEIKREVKKLVCPRCGANLVKRKSEYGLFYGCSNYPKCKFILNK